MWGAYNVGGYQKFSIQAHDGGHGSIGPTMAVQEVAAFDPVFWFFHCNLDRLWLRWQQTVGATTLNGFKSTVTGDVTWLDGPAPLNGLTPFTTTTDQSIDLGVDYAEDHVLTEDHVAFENTAGSVEASRSFKIKSAAPVSVRVKDIARFPARSSCICSPTANLSRSGYSSSQTLHEPAPIVQSRSSSTSTFA
jgi:tyrosinase